MIEKAQENTLKMDMFDEKRSEDSVVAYVDGSYYPNLRGVRKTSYGVVLVSNGNSVELSESYDNHQYAKSCDLAGKVEGVHKAIDWAVSNGKKELTIYTNHNGIVKWINREWGASKEMTQKLVSHCDSVSDKIKIECRHLKSGSGVVFAENARELARKALYK